MHQGAQRSIWQHDSLAELSSQIYIVPNTPLTDTEVPRILLDIEEAIRFRLQMSKLIPVEMARYQIGNTIPNSTSNLD